MALVVIATPCLLTCVCLYRSWEFIKKYYRVWKEREHADSIDEVIFNCGLDVFDDSGDLNINSRMIQ